MLSQAPLNFAGTKTSGSELTAAFQRSSLLGLHAASFQGLDPNDNKLCFGSVGVANLVLQLRPSDVAEGLIEVFVGKSGLFFGEGRRWGRSWGASMRASY